jgi:hypothetical protein
MKLVEENGFRKWKRWRPYKEAISRVFILRSLCVLDLVRV